MKVFRFMIGLTTYVFYFLTITNIRAVSKTANLDSTSTFKLQQRPHPHLTTTPRHVPTGSPSDPVESFGDRKGRGAGGMTRTSDTRNSIPQKCYR